MENHHTCCDGSVIKFVLMHGALPPTKGSEFAAGFDLRTPMDYTVLPWCSVLINVGIAIELPHGCYARIAPRSSLAWYSKIMIGGGVVDEDYRGPIHVVLFNFSDQPVMIAKGSKIAQLIPERIFYPQMKEVQALDATERGTGRFGSTGS